MDPREQLDVEGYVVLVDQLDRDAIDGIRSTVRALAQDGDQDRESGTVHVDLDPYLDCPVFAPMRASSGLAGLAEHVAKSPVTLRRTHARDPRPGYGAQQLHSDWLPRRHPTDPFVGITVLWMLDDFTAINGATRLVPGTHQQARDVPREVQRAGFVHPEEIVVAEPAGSVLVFNAHLWHSGRRNDSGSGRLVIQQQYLAVSFVSSQGEAD
jgi:hypothetical protein